MFRRPIAWLTACTLALPVLSLPLGAQVVPPTELTEEAPRYSANQLDNLLGPVALYPDALLAQVLVAATFPDQVEDAARYVRANGTAGIDDQSWDISVKAVAHYASALNMMADKSDWTTTLGVAYANQSSEVMASVQRLRALAAQHGNLVSTPQQQVVTEGNTYVITPAQPRVVYVPVYDPVVIYSRPVFGAAFASRFWSFGVGFPIGGWLSYDCDWRLNRVYYNGWNTAFFEYGGGWRARSRPFIQITNIYVSPRYRNVYVNRDVYRRPINYRNVDRYAGIHRDTYFDGRRDGYRDGYRDGRDRDVRGGDGRDRGNDGYTGRTAQPRADRPVATPEGYRDGSDRSARSTVAVPEDRRVEQTSTVRAMGIAPGDREGRGEPRGENVREPGTVNAAGDDEARDARRRGQPRMAMPQVGTTIAPPPPNTPIVDDRAQSARSDRSGVNRTINQMPRSSPPRQSEPRQPQTREAPPAPRQAEPRQAQPRQGGESRAAGPRVERSSGGGGGGAPRGSDRSARPRG
jgi:hypothetical protein